MSLPERERGRPRGEGGPFSELLVRDDVGSAAEGSGGVRQTTLDALALTGDPRWQSGYESGLLAGNEAGQADGYKAGRPDGFHAGWQAADAHAALVHASAHRIVADYLTWTRAQQQAEVQCKKAPPAPVRPVPPYAACLASWQQPRRRETAG